MNKLLCALGIICLLTACKSNAKLFDGKGIKLIRIEVTKKNTILRQFDVANPEKIGAIVDGLNNCTQKLLYFHSAYTVIIIYANGLQRMAFCSGNSMMVDGFTYKLDKRAEEIVK